VAAELRWSGTPSWWNYFGRIGLAALFGVGAVGLPLMHFERQGTTAVVLLLIAVAVFLSACVRKFSNRYAVSERSVLATYGLLSQETHEIDVVDIQDLVLKQSMMGRIFNYGTIEFSSAGTENAEIVFASIADPGSVKQLVSELKQANRHNVR